MKCEGRTLAKISMNCNDRSKCKFDLIILYPSYLKLALCVGIFNILTIFMVQDKKVHFTKNDLSEHNLHLPKL